MHDLTAFQRDILFVLAGLENPHGLGIKAELETYYDGEVHHGRLYPNLNTLVEKGLVEKQTVDRRTNSYTLSARGEQTIDKFRDWKAKYVDERPNPPTP